MNKIITIGLIALGLVSIAIGVFIWMQSKKPTAALKVDSNPQSLVFVDNIQIGQTPVEKFFIPSEVAVKLIPSSTTSALPSYQTKVRLTKETYTIIKRDFGSTESESAGDIISLEPQKSKTASLAIVTASPDSASVTLDGLPQGFTPLLVSPVIPGDHQILVTAPGFGERAISAKAVVGYKLTINVKLAGQTQVAPIPTPEPEMEAIPSPTIKPKSSPKPSPTVIAGVYVSIIDTDKTGYVNLRSGPGTGFLKLGKVYPGDKFKLLDSKNNWYQIRVDLDSTNSAWISAKYTEKKGE
jgi:hypothetical protein